MGRNISGNHRSQRFSKIHQSNFSKDSTSNLELNINEWIQRILLDPWNFHKWKLQKRRQTMHSCFESPSYSNPNEKFSATLVKKESVKVVPCQTQGRENKALLVLQCQMITKTWTSNQVVHLSVNQIRSLPQGENRISAIRVWVHPLRLETKALQIQKRSKLNSTIFWKI